MISIIHCIEFIQSFVESKVWQKFYVSKWKIYKDCIPANIYSR